VHGRYIKAPKDTVSEEQLADQAVQKKHKVNKIRQRIGGYMAAAINNGAGCTRRRHGRLYLHCRYCCAPVQAEEAAFGTYASQGGEKFVYRVKKEGAFGGYKVRTIVLWHTQLVV
jgi:hypothetical protein